MGVCALKTKATFKTMRLYPKETALVLVENFIENLDYPHYRWVTTITGKLTTQEKLDVFSLNSILNKIKEIGWLWFFMGLLCMLCYPFLWLLVVKHIFRKFKEKQYLYLLAILSFFSYLFLPTILAVVAGRIRLPIEWLIVLLATIEFYHLWDAYKSRRKATHVVKF